MGSGCSPGGPTHPGEAHRPWGWRTSPWWAGGTAQEGHMRQRIRNQREKRGRWERREGLHLPNLVGFGLEREDFPPLARPTPLGLLEPQGKAPPLPPIYTEVLGLIRDNFSTAARPHTSTVFPLDRVSAKLGRSLAETRSSPTSGAPSRCRRTLLPLRLSCWIKKAEIIVELYVC